MQSAKQMGASEQTLRDAYQKARRDTEARAEPLSAEDQSVQSMPDASPTKWHLAHTSWFFETFVLRPFLPGYRPFHDDYDALFNSYYNSVGEQFPRHQRGLISRPGSDEVLAYRRHVDVAMHQMFESPNREALRFLELGIHHEQQHQELLLTDIKHALSHNPLAPVYTSQSLFESQSRPVVAPPPKLQFVGFEGGVVEIGHGADDFHYDNEGPQHRAFLEDFEIANRPINNEDVLTFIEAGGYSNPLLWLSEGYAFVSEHGLKCPLYFRPTETGYLHFTLHGLMPVDPAETACHLTYFEADAIARFMGARLPTEQEWECAAMRTFPEQPAFNPTSIRPGIPASPSDQSSAIVAQMLGGVWEWTQSSYSPYPGYQPPSGAVGEYNGKFMHNQYVLRGGSCATSTGHVRTTYRNFFPSNARWQFSGARLAQGTNRA